VGILILGKPSLTLLRRDGVISYEALPPKDIKFQPLNKDRVYDASEMMELYEVGRDVEPPTLCEPRSAG
jgi:hypothetical protein